MYTVPEIDQSMQRPAVRDGESIMSLNNFTGTGTYIEGDGKQKGLKWGQHGN